MVRRIAQVRSLRLGGATWIEMLIALFVIGLTASAFSVLLPMASKTETMAATYQQASSVVQHKIDQLRAVGYGRLTYSELQSAGIIDSSPQSPPYNFTATDALNSVHARSTGTISISDFDSSNKLVVVSVVWTTGTPARADGDVTVNCLIPKT